MKTLRQALQSSRPCITAELPPQRFPGPAAYLEAAEALACAVDAVHITADEAGRGQVSALALAALLLRRGIDPVPHIDCRDRNRIALQSDLLGLRSIGVSSLAVTDGTVPRAGLGQAKPVFDVTADELLATVNAMNEEDWAEPGQEIVAGSCATVEQVEMDLAGGLLERRSGLGARFLHIRPGGDPALLRRCIQTMIECRLTWRYSIIVSIEVTANAATGAELMRDALSLPGVSGINLLCRDDPADVMATIGAYHQAGMPG